MDKEYEQLRDDALGDLKAYMDRLDAKNGKKIAYWIRDYAAFLRKERDFDPKKLLRYPRGSVIKVHLGYRLGSEEGGLHYAIVLDSNNTWGCSVVTIVPLTSVKATTDLNNLNPANIMIGNEIYDTLNNKLNTEIPLARAALLAVQEKAKKMTIDDDTSEISKELRRISNQISYCEKMKKEVSKMKRGSIVLVGQIVTVSKLRIYDPKYPGAALFNIRVSSETLDKIDNKIAELFGPVKKE